MNHPVEIFISAWSKAKHIDDFQYDGDVFKDAFDAIPSIRRFFAAGNRLQILRSFSSNPLKELNEADFHSNHIRLIHSTFIDNLPNVESINLAQNHLQNLPDNLFQSSIHSINMEGNPVNCDCR